MLEKIMDEIFKKKLAGLRNAAKPTNFAQALFGEVHWLAKEAIDHKVELSTSVDFSEKKQVLDSLERFAQDKIEQSPVNKIEIPGGEILKKADPTWDAIHLASSKASLLSDLTVDRETIKVCLDAKEAGKIRLIFVPESFRPYEEYSGDLKEEAAVNGLLPFFPLKTAELFSRMIGAMKLKPEEVLVFASQYQDKDISAEVMKIVAFFKPEVIVTLGAAPTQKILKGQERLTQVHGQFFTRKIEGVGSFTVVPLFHPSIIENNLNMKKAAWTDMQKIMSHLNLL